MRRISGDVKLNAEVVKPLDFADALKTAMRHGFDAAAAGETFVDAWVGFTGDESPAVDRVQQALVALDNSKPVGDDAIAEVGPDGKEAGEVSEAEDQWLVVKRDPYYRQEQGYTGIRDEAARYTFADARKHANPLAGVTMIRLSEAPEFTPACFPDLALKHVLKQRDAARRVQPKHPDDRAVDRFAAAMKAKLAEKRNEGRGGWEDKTACTAEFLSELLRGHVDKGDPLDVGNLAMMLHQRGERIEPKQDAPSPDVAGLIEALHTAYDFIASEYRDEKSAALDGEPFAKEARPVIAAIGTALSRLTPPKQDERTRP